MKQPPSLKSRFQILVLLSACLPVFLAGGFLILYLQIHFKQEIGDQTDRQARHVLSEIDEYLAIPLSTLFTGRTLVDSDETTPRQLAGFLASASRENPFIDALVLMSPEGEVIISSGDPPLPPSSPPKPNPRHFSEEGSTDSLKIIDKGATLFPVVYLSETGRPSLPISLSWEQHVLVGYINLDFLREIIDENAGVGVTIEIYDANGHLLASGEDWNENMRREFPARRLGQSRTQRAEGNDHLTSKLLVPGLGWTILVDQDLHDLLGPVQHVSQVVLFGTVSAFIFAILTIRPAIHRLLRPLEVLRQRTREFAGNETFNSRIPESSYREINELFQSFEYLSSHLQVRQNTMHESKEWYKMLFDASEDAVFILNLNENDAIVHFLEANKSACKLTGYSPAELSFMTLEDLGLTEEPGAYERMLHVLFRRKKVLFEALLKTREQNQIPMEFNILLVENPGYRYVLAIGRDITERKKAAEKIERMAFFDSLTGLPNRSLLMDRLYQSIIRAQRHGSVVCVLFIDLDQFKQANDELGHEKGDELLMKIARRLEASVRKNDTIARLGGDEFIVLLSELRSGEEGADIARKILRKLTEPIRLEADEVVIGCSVGISVYPNDAEDGEELIRYADLAMYHVKQNGRNAYRFFSPGMNTASEEKKKTGRLIQEAVEQQAFTLDYQPKMTLDPVGIAGFEAFLRWDDPELSGMGLSKTIVLAEETGLIVQIGDWVLNEACRKCRELQEAYGRELLMTVNISVVQLQQMDFVDRVESALNNSGLPPERLELDLPESLLSPGFNCSLQKLEKLKTLGVKLSLDGLGDTMGYIHRLKTIPLHTLKFHGEFLDGLSVEPTIADVAKAMISLAHSLRLTVVAEEIEEQWQFRFLRDERCDLAQGFLFSRPLTDKELLGFIADRRRAERKKNDPPPQ